MAKSLLTKYTTFALCSLSKNKTQFKMYMPVQYTLSDVLEIIRLFTGYTDIHPWNIYNPYHKEKKMENALFNTDLKTINFTEYKGETPFIVITYGSLTITVGCRGGKKSAKVYPFEIRAFGRFPEEKEIKQEEASESELYDYNQLVYLTRDMRQDIIYHSDDELESFIRSTTLYFKSKYKLTDSIIDGYYGEENKLEVKS